MSAALTATEFVLAREQKLHALDGLAAAAAHELGTPLATIVLVTKELERDLESRPCRSCRGYRAAAQPGPTLPGNPAEADPEPGGAGPPARDTVDRPAASTRRRTPIGPAASTIIDRCRARAVAAGAIPRLAAVEPVGERRPGVIYGLGNIVENAVDFAARQVEITARWNGTRSRSSWFRRRPRFRAGTARHHRRALCHHPSAGPASRARARRKRQAAAAVSASAFSSPRRCWSGPGPRRRLRQPDRRAETGAIVRIAWPRADFRGPRRLACPAGSSTPEAAAILNAVAHLIRPTRLGLRLAQSSMLAI